MNGECNECPYKRTRERNDLLSEVRDRHNKRFCNNPALKGLAYFDGWSQIATLTNRCFMRGGKGYSSLSKEDQERAVEFAQKVSDLFYEYTLHQPKTAEKENKDE